MDEELYQKLAQHLDNLPGGFPPTESGVELRILRRLFSSEETELALHLTLIPEEPRVIARRAKLSRHPFHLAGIGRRQRRVPARTRRVFEKSSG